MKAQELPLSTIVLVALGAIFLIVLVFAVGNIGLLSGFFQDVSPDTPNADCQALCNQASGFDPAELANLDYCVNGCTISCVVIDSEGTIRYLHDECP